MHREVHLKEIVSRENRVVWDVPERVTRSSVSFRMRATLYTQRHKTKNEKNKRKIIRIRTFLYTKYLYHVTYTCKRETGLIAVCGKTLTIKLTTY